MYWYFGMETAAHIFVVYQVASAAARAVDSYRMEDSVSFMLPRIPLFIRAAELSAVVSRHGQNDVFGMQTLEELAGLFIWETFKDKPAVASMLAEFLKMKHILFLIDGLDEAADNRGFIEECIDRTSRDQSNIRLMVSTREYAFESSRACRRLGAFNLVKIQSLDQDQRNDLIKRRLRDDSGQKFRTQLEFVLEQNPEMAGSPFLLCLLIKVFKTEGTIPTSRHHLYERLVQGLLANHTVKLYTNISESANDMMQILMRIFCKHATEFLQTLALVCHLRLHQRDFQWCSGEHQTKIQEKMQEIWRNEDLSLKDMGRSLLEPSTVGLLSNVGEGQYRFSHLTLQEYLAAKCILRLYNCDVRKILDQLSPLHDRWAKEVAQFVASMLPEEQFKSFCELVLQNDDGTGVHCELVNDFLKERGGSEEVHLMVRNRLQTVRGTESLIAGLCHPSLELRNRVLSEMKKFEMPPNPFSDGTTARLRQIAEDKCDVWHKRAAAIISLAQIAQMDHCQECDGRADTLAWLLGMLMSFSDDEVESGSDSNHEIYFPLVKGLGILLKGQFDDQNLHVDASSRREDDAVVLKVLQTSIRLGSLPEAIADLDFFSTPLLVWFLDQHAMLVDGSWPARHLLCMCKKISPDDNERVVRLVQKLLDRMHASSLNEKDLSSCNSSLSCIQERFGGEIILSPMLRLLDTGEVSKRVRMIAAAKLLKPQFGSNLHDFGDVGVVSNVRKLTSCLLKDVGYTSSTTAEGGATCDNTLLAYVMDKHPVLIEYLLEILDGGSTLPGAESKSDALPIQSIISRLKERHPGSEIKDDRQMPEFGEFVEENILRKGVVAPPIAVSGKQDQQPSVTLQLKDVDNMIVEFCSRRAPDLENLDHDNRPSELIYVCAELWMQSDLMTQKFEDDLKHFKTPEAVLASDNLFGLTSPWIQGGAARKSRQWALEVCESLKFEALGRFLVPVLLKHIRDRFISESTIVINEHEELASVIQQWEPANAEQLIEKRLLLKELYVGRRELQMPAWAGQVSPTKQRVVINHEDAEGLKLSLDALHPGRTPKRNFSDAADHAQAIVKELKTKSKSDFFNDAVDVLRVKQYYKEDSTEMTVWGTEMMHFQKMMLRADSKIYGKDPKTRLALVEKDLNTIVYNAIIYNPYQHVVHVEALKLYKAAQSVIRSWQVKGDTPCRECGHDDDASGENPVNLCDYCCTGIHVKCLHEFRQDEKWCHPLRDFRQTKAWFCSDQCKSVFEELSSHFKLDALSSCEERPPRRRGKDVKGQDTEIVGKWAVVLDSATASASTAANTTWQEYKVHSLQTEQYYFDLQSEIMF